MLTALLIAASSLAGASNPCSKAGLALPERPALSLGGADFTRQSDSLSPQAREQAIVEQIVSGNLPDFLRQAAPVTLTGRLAGGGLARITVCALPDYLAIGSDRDHVLVPMGLPAAWAAATRLGFALPTSKMVDAIHQQARAQLSPQPLPPGPMMSSTAYYFAHSEMARRQRALIGARLGELTAGHKKDVVLSNLLWTQPGRVAIYGWHRLDGSAIQPLSVAHHANYADYSHGVRLIAPIAYVNGSPRALMTLMSQPDTAAILSHEGQLRPL